MKNTKLPLDKMYEQMGRDAFHADMPRRPVADKELMDEYIASHGNGAPLFALWLKGWDMANLEATY